MSTERYERAHALARLLAKTAQNSDCGNDPPAVYLALAMMREMINRGAALAWNVPLATVEAIEAYANTLARAIADDNIQTGRYTIEPPPEQ